ncbi:MAG TPA: Rpp14/Pop5 family protein [archaeon]|nr:Rpp14/Pop5 family protein [archaeon]
MSLKKPPSMRGKKRYLIFRLHSDSPASFQDVREAVWNSILNWLGDNEAPRADIHIVKNLWNQKEQSGFIRCDPKYVDSVKLALALIHQIGDQRVIFQTVRVAGTIKSGKEKALRST